MKSAKFTNLFLFVFSLLFAIFFAEFCLRIFSEEKEIKVDHEIIGHQFVSGGEIDENGFRNTSILNQYDIIAIGDSQTFGTNASQEESWPHVLEKIGGKSVYQMAGGGYGVAQYFYFFDQALKFNPELVIIGLYLGNDLLDTQRLVYSKNYWEEYRINHEFNFQDTQESLETYSRIKEGIDEDSFAYKSYKIRNWIRGKSKIYMLLGNSTRNLREKLGLSETEDEKAVRKERWIKKNKDLAYVYESKSLKTILSPVYRLETLDLDNKNAAEGFRLIKIFLNKMSKRANENNVKFLVAIIPTKELVYGKLVQNEEGEINNVLKNLFSKEIKLIDEIFSFCEQNNIGCVDTSGNLYTSLKNGLKIYPETLNGHPNAVGYKAIAESIYDYLNISKASSTIATSSNKM